MSPPLQPPSPPPHPDRARWNAKYHGDHAPRRVDPSLVQHANRLTRGRVLDLAGGMGQNALWLAAQDPRWQPVVADISDVALRAAALGSLRVLCDAAALPFARHSFDTILCVRFFDARVRFADWLAPGGTVLFETFTLADAKYRPGFNPAHRFDPSDSVALFGELEILLNEETDDGTRVVATVIARRPIR